MATAETDGQAPPDGDGEAVTRFKQRTALLALAVAVGVLVLKGWGALVSGSTGVLAMAVEAMLDVTSAAMTYVVVRFADRPPDRDHPYGHGRYEQGAALFQAGLMFTMAVGLVYESVHRWTAAEAVRSPGLGIAVMAVTGLGGFFWGRLLLARARRTGSPSLRAFGRMVMADCLTDVAVLTTLGLYAWTGWLAWDVGISILVGLYIFYEGLQSAGGAWREFTDHRVDPDEEQKIVDLCEDFVFVKGIHDLRTRASGGSRIVDLHARFCRSLSLHEAHHLAERLTQHIEREIPRSNVLVHADPCATCQAPNCAGWRAIGEPVRMRVLLDKTLADTQGDVREAARRLDMGKDELGAKLREYGVDPAIYERDAD